MEMERVFCLHFALSFAMAIGNPLLKILGNAVTGERILQRPTRRHLWAIGRPRMRSCKWIFHCLVVVEFWFYQLGELELELIQTQMTQKPMLRAEAGMRVRCANKASAGCIMRGRGIGQNSRKNCKKRGICG